MICYIDSSVLLRRLFGESKPLKEWKQIRQGFSSQLIRLECLRTIDRLRLKGALTDEETAKRLAGFHEIVAHLGLLPLSQQVLKRAEQSFTTLLGSSDSLHLATALLWREKTGGDFVFATHDVQLGRAAQAHGFEVMGL